MAVNPKITVLMPVYNGEKYLNKAIESILNQTYIDFEFLILNDGSTDRSVNIIESYKSARIQLVHNKVNVGLTATLNKGIDLARGDYIARMDCDDISLEKRFESQLAIMEKNKEIGLCSTNAMTINEHGEVVSDAWWTDDQIPIEWHMLWSNPIAHPSVMIRKSVLNENNLRYDLAHICNDYILWCKMILVTKAYRLNDVLLLYRTSASSLYLANKDKILDDAIHSNEKLIETIAKTKPPIFHSDFTSFKQALGIKVDYYLDIKSIKDWMKHVVYSSASRWNWDRDIVKRLHMNINQKMIDYIAIMPMTKTNNLLIILINVRLDLSFQYAIQRLLIKAKKEIKYIYKRLL